PRRRPQQQAISNRLPALPNTPKRSRARRSRRPGSRKRPGRTRSSADRVVRMTLRRRDMLRVLTASAVTAFVPRIARAAAAQAIYALPRFGNGRGLPMSDPHAQLDPVRYREPSVNLGIGAMQGRPPHLVGEAYLRHFGIAPHSRHAHALTYLDFAEATRRYG